MNLDELENVIFFDGVCVLCSRSMKFIVKRDRAKRFRFCAIQSDRGRAVFESAGMDPEAPDSIVLVQDGVLHTESGAILRIARGLGGFWRLAGIFRLVPPPLRNWAYRFIARHRYRWFGKSEACDLPTEEIRERTIC